MVKLLNAGNYKHLVDSNVNYTYEVNRFLLPGHFETSIGDAMPLAAANALNIPIALVTSVESMPFIIVTPEVESITSLPLFLAFTQEGTGHYDSLVEAAKMQNTQQSLPQKELRCRCGVNNRDPDSINCCIAPKTNIAKKRTYSSRCKCFKAGLKCGEKCKCRNCGNGRKPGKPSSRKSHKDKFVRKSFNQYTKPEAFLLKREGSHNVRLGFSILELMILEFCLLFMGHKNGIKNIENVAELYNSCIDYYNRNNKHQTLVRRSVKQIKKQVDKLKDQNEQK